MKDPEFQKSPPYNGDGCGGFKWADIDLQNEIIHVKDPKSGISRPVYMTPQVKDMLLERLPENVDLSSLIFPGKNGKKKKLISKTFFRIVHKLGFNDGITDPRDKVVFHTLRHTFASWLAIKGIPIYTIKELMGHKSLANDRKI
ncbi:Integrase [Dissulfuribacter thermophilus]|uniref:Integrase n=1 Tax=Dissulfuribacter thermophilus TaxID=1156395 RepID=A0A1B9F9I6_9BACT|nr:site-specific integrase [Dissulfuribacter thermophilus]OCC16577.1 Integrase [Dissulfuribacter thermophilus]